MNPKALSGVAPLQALVALSLSGADARTFLQGQLSNDMKRLAPGRALLASCNSPRGKVQAVLTLVPQGDQIIALVPASLAARTLARLRSHVLRAKVTIAETGAALVLAPLSAAQAAAITDHPPQAPGEVLTEDGCTLLRWWGADARYLLLAPPEAVTVEDSPLQDLAWRRADIAAGLPQVHPQTHELFIAQMLNIDLLDGISFDKGCYTGQEIIARMRYRSTVKRRTLRFSAACPAPAPGHPLLSGTEQVGEVVDAVGAADGCELLAVVTLTHRSETLCLQGLPDSPLQPLPLPYAIPEAIPEVIPETVIPETVPKASAPLQQAS